MNENDEMVDRSPSGVDNVEDNNKESTSVDLDAHKSITIPSRTAVLQACTVTSGLIAVSGVLIRQVCLTFCILPITLPVYEKQRSLTVEQYSRVSNASYIVVIRESKIKYACVFIFLVGNGVVSIWDYYISVVLQ